MLPPEEMYSREGKRSRCRRCRPGVSFSLNLLWHWTVRDLSVVVMEFADVAQHVDDPGLELAGAVSPEFHVRQLSMCIIAGWVFAVDGSDDFFAVWVLCKLSERIV